LDVLDRKASSLITLNSILFGVVTLFAVRPMLDAVLAEKPSPILGVWQIGLTFLSIFVSLLAIAASLIIYRIRWPYAGHVTSASDWSPWRWK